MEKLLYSIKEVATILGVSKSLVYKLVKQEKISILEIENRKLIKAETIEQIVLGKIDLRKK
ncbi:helix-turn-helix domain-containing protein [Clostridium sp. MD294]|uniref:helix-turn-helix domain-containing protein n=1 Tax=Clostridium sp. MD294 TaxID=97138 RepID=UPI0002CBE829|nr:helix-turn-helix domain-containing protein [Clostridium sp. MD294]NDO47260.1 helix-turn-helix domain-containing protein [Clostridium sp. MD294]USF29673.1 hypothetical protein C820_001074 [Clostridium sp. MD294]